MKLSDIVAEGVNTVGQEAKDALALLCADLFPKIGIEQTEETIKAFSAGIGMSAARRLWRDMEK